MRSLIILLLLPVLACAQQVKEIGHSDLFGSTSAQTAIGGTITKSNVVSLLIEGKIMPTRGYVWIAGDGSQCDDDTMKVLVIGYQGGKESFSYLDTLYLPIHEDSSNIGEFSFTLPSGGGFINRIKLGYTPESGSANDSIAFYSGLFLEKSETINIASTFYYYDPDINLDTDADSIRGKAVSQVAPTDNYILKWDAGADSIMWEADLTGTDGQNADSIMGKAISIIPPTDNYILKWDAGDDSIKWEADGGEGFLAWSDTVGVLATVSDTIPLHNQIVLKLNAADTNYTDSTDVKGWNYMNEDSSLYATQTDLGDYLALADTNYTDSSDVKGWNFMNEDSALYATQTDLLVKADTTWVTSYIDTATVIFWPDTGATIATISDTIPLHNQIILKLAIADTAPLHNQIALKLNIADTSSFSNQFALKLNISDTSSFSNQFALKLNISDTSSFANQFALKLNSADTNYTDSTDVKGWNYMNEDSALYATQTDIGAKADSGAVGYLAQNETITGNWVNTSNPWADNEIASSATWNARIDSALIVTWPDTVATVVTVSDTIPLHNQIVLKLAIADTAPLHNQIVLKLNIADTASFSNQFALKAPIDNPTFTTGITVPDNSISDEEINEGGNFNWTGAHVFTGDLDISASTPDADGEVEFTGGDFYGHNGTANHVLAMSNKQLVFAIDNPKHLTHDSVFVWTNRTGHTFTIDSVYSIARQDDYDYDLVESAVTGGTVTLIESITVTTDGTGWYYNIVTDIDHAAIQTGMGILFVQSADSTDNVTCTIYGRYTD